MQRCISMGVATDNALVCCVDDRDNTGISFTMNNKGTHYDLPILGKHNMKNARFQALWIIVNWLP